MTQIYRIEKHPEAAIFKTVAILTLDCAFEKTCRNVAHSGFMSTFSKWVELSGAMVVPLRFDASQAEMDFILDSVNGVFFTGGDDMGDTYNVAFDYVYKKAVMKNKQGVHFPVWGTCLGFENIVRATAGEILQPLNVNFTQLPLTFQNYRVPPGLDVFDDDHFPGAAVYKEDFAKPLAWNFHQWILSPAAFVEHMTDFELIAKSKSNDTEFVAFIQHKKWPIFATQFHPEGFLSIVVESHEILKDDPFRGVLPNTHLAQFFGDQLRRNTQQFPVGLRDRYLLNNYQPIFLSVDGPAELFVFYYVFPPSQSFPLTQSGLVR